MNALKSKYRYPEDGGISQIDNNILHGRKVFLPQLSVEGSAHFAAALRSVGIEAEVYPDSDSETLRLGGQLTSGDECYPQKITLGNLYKIVLDKDFDPDRSAFFFATTGGPCRFGQYVPYLKKVLRDMGYPQIPVISPTSDTGYNALGEGTGNFQRTAWRAVVCADILRKLILKTRPHEINSGETDKMHQECLHFMCKIIEIPGRSNKQKMQDLQNGLEEVRDRFRKIEVNNERDKLFIGVVGEIFCRHEEFANNFLIRSVEKLGGEVWLANIAEWVAYTDFIYTQRLIIQNKVISKDMLKVKIKSAIQHSDEKKLYEPFKKDFKGYEEPEHTDQILARGASYLPYRGAMGEMVLSIGTSLHLYDKGIDGIIDISPFTCMNGIVTEAIYPKISKDHNNLPMRVFYFDGTETDLDRDLSIFLDLARTYRRRKKKKRVYPHVFHF
jgi:predicted nucleotide-binding protein (sugar kinase/HSP70/actin superfamily)